MAKKYGCPKCGDTATLEYCRFCRWLARRCDGEGKTVKWQCYRSPPDANGERGRPKHLQEYCGEVEIEPSDHWGSSVYGDEYKWECDNCGHEFEKAVEVKGD